MKQYIKYDFLYPGILYDKIFYEKYKDDSVVEKLMELLLNTSDNREKQRVYIDKINKRCHDIEFIDKLKNLVNNIE